MTTKTFANNTMEIAQTIVTIPLLTAALIGAIPILLLCTACRCCKGTCNALIEYINH